jgi:hypothetical protein
MSAALTAAVTVTFSATGAVVVGEEVVDEEVVDDALVDAAGLVTDAEGWPDEHPASATDPPATAMTRASNFFDAIALLM